MLLFFYELFNFDAEKLGEAKKGFETEVGFSGFDVLKMTIIQANPLFNVDLTQSDTSAVSFDVLANLSEVVVEAHYTFLA